MTSCLLGALILVQAAAAPASHAGGPAHVKVRAVPVRQEDIHSIDGVMSALYQVLSGPAGHAREWGRDATLYLGDCRFIWWETDDAGKAHMVNVDHQGAVDRLDAEMVEKGYFVREIHRVSQIWGNMAQIFSTYEARETPDGAVTGRGVNSLQLVNDGKRWWIMSLTFDEETPGHSIPREFLP